MQTSYPCVTPQVCGAFLSTDLIQRKKYDSEEPAYFGTGESFVFTVREITQSTDLKSLVLQMFFPLILTNCVSVKNTG